MYSDDKIWMAKSDKPIYVLPKMANRHGLISGATGTGKTITLKVMAESFSDMGVPVFLADVKGDLAGMCMPGEESEGMKKRIARFGLAEKGFAYKAYPTCFWDVFGEAGHPVRATISEMGPLLLARLLDLNDTQAGVLSIVFRVADDRGMLLLDLKDLRAMLSYVAQNAKSYTLDYGNIAPQSVGAIQRALLTLEDEGGDIFFGEPSLDIEDWMKKDSDGRGFINILHCVRLFQHPSLYATFLLWMLSELYDTLPECGDCDKPKMIFFFDEAHLLFDDAPKVLLQKIEQVVRLIRSKGVGVFFVTQNPKDVPDSIAAQLANRVQHGLRAFSPAEQRVVRAVAETFRVNPAFDTASAILELATGEALVSFLQEDGSPSVVERAFILPPQSLMGGIDEATRRGEIEADAVGHKYDAAVDRDSAYEFLQAKYEREADEKQEDRERARRLKEEEAERRRREREEEEERERQEKLDAEERKRRLKIEDEERRREARRLELEERERLRQEKAQRKTFYGTTAGRGKTPIERMADNAMSSAGRQIASTLVRSILGSLLKKK